MKYSFSTKGWHGRSFEDFCRAARHFGFGGIELHNIHNPLFTEKTGAFYDYTAAATLRNLREKRLEIPCIDVIGDIADPASAASCLSEAKECLRIADNLKIPFVRMRAELPKTCDVSDAVRSVKNFLTAALSEAEKDRITILLETAGLFCKTALLRDVLEDFASDYLAALWNFSAAFLGAGESPEEVIRNLGAYVRHVHVNDAAIENGRVEYRLLGEGQLPLSEMMLALRSVNYDGYLSLVWDPKWCPEIDDMEIVFAQYIDYIRAFGDISRNETTLYYNKTHTGKYVWKKDLLIDETFPQVLDRMVREFPDQYAFRYTTLDYTRTYSEFRDDVDQFARVLIALGVKAGTHVAVWA